MRRDRPQTLPRWLLHDRSPSDRDSPIKVNSADPGGVKTEIVDSNVDREVAEGGKTSAELATLRAQG